MPDSSRNDVATLIAATQNAIDLSEAADRAIKERDRALDRLIGLAHGDRFSAITNAQQRIGYLMTKERRNA